MTTEPGPDPGAAVEAVCADAERVRRRELSTALRAMEAGGELPESQRAAVEAMSEAIVAGLLADPVRVMADGDRGTAGTALRLFDLAERPAVEATAETSPTGVSSGD